MKQIVLIDNYDSFTYNLQHCFTLAEAKVAVHHPDYPLLKKSIRTADGIVISPGPSHPANALHTRNIVQEFYKDKPIFGVCLGMQIINEIFGGTTKRAPLPVHGKTAQIDLDLNSPLFRGMPGQIKAARYHSLICDSIAPSLNVIAQYNNIVMALQHTKYPIYGVQFHPESFLSEYGRGIIHNFVSLV